MSMKDTMKDNTKQPISGYFLLEVLNKEGEVIEKIEQKNTIMDASKRSVADSIRGISSDGAENYADNFISTFAMGTKGTNPDGTIKYVDSSSNGMFCQQQTGSDVHDGDFMFIHFDKPSVYGVDTINGDDSTLLEVKFVDKVDGSLTDSSLTEYNVSIISTSQTKITYNILIRNGGGNINAVTPYNECALYVQNKYDIGSAPVNLGNIFASRTFALKNKDLDTSFRIKWTIVF